MIFVLVWAVLGRGVRASCGGGGVGGGCKTFSLLSLVALR